MFNVFLPFYDTLLTHQSWKSSAAVRRLQKMDCENKGILIEFNSWRAGSAFLMSRVSSACSCFPQLEKEVSVTAQSSLRFTSPPSFLSSLSSLSNSGQPSHWMSSQTLLSGPQLFHPRAVAAPVDSNPMKWIRGTCNLLVSLTWDSKRNTILNIHTEERDKTSKNQWDEL